MTELTSTLVQALRLCTGRTALKESRGIALLFLDHGTRREWGVSVTPRPLFSPGKDPVPFVQKAGWAPGPVWTGAENLAPTGIRSPARPARSQSLYRLSYPGPSVICPVRIWLHDRLSWRRVCVVSHATVSSCSVCRLEVAVRTEFALSGAHRHFFPYAHLMHVSSVDKCKRCATNTSLFFSRPKCRQSYRQRCNCLLIPRLPPPHHRHFFVCPSLQPKTIKGAIF